MISIRFNYHADTLLSVSYFFFLFFLVSHGTDIYIGSKVQKPVYLVE